MTHGIQQGDYLLHHTPDNGDVTIEEGILEMTQSFETAAYLSLFGGNEEDDGSLDSPLQWWGNLDETDANKHMRSEAQHVLRSLPATSGNLLRLQDAVKRDMNWLLTTRAANEINVSIGVPRLNWVNIRIRVTAVGREEQFEFTENWKAAPL